MGDKNLLVLYLIICVALTFSIVLKITVNAFVKGLLLEFLLGTPNRSILLTALLGNHQVQAVTEESVTG